MATVLLPDQDVIATEGCDATFLVELTGVDGTVPDASTATARYVASVYATGQVRVRLEWGDGLSWETARRMRVRIPAARLAGLGGLSLMHEIKIWDALGNASHSMRGALIVRTSAA